MKSITHNGVSKRYVLTLTALFLLTIQAWAQQLHGTVTDVNTGEPIFGATISLTTIKDGNALAITDSDGKFTINVKTFPATLVISYIGYKKEEYDVFEVTHENLDIHLTEDVSSLSEVVVTGVAQGTSRKGLSFALTKVDNSLITTVPATDASTSLRGKVAGLRVEQTGGDAGASVYLRGAKSISSEIEPLIVIDGFVTNLKLSDISPNDIESIEVVKGAAASALYGTRGEGGVIQVITKKGSRDRLSVLVDNEVGFNHAINIPKTSQYHHYNINSDGTFALTSGNRTIDYQSNGFSVNLHPYYTSYDNVGNILTDQVYYNNNIALSAGDDKYKFYLSLQNQHKGGVTDAIDSDTKQSILFNLNYKPTNNWDFEFTSQYSNSNTPSQILNTSYTSGLVYSALLMEPFVNLAQKNAAGAYLVEPDGYEVVGTKFSNPLYELTTQEYKYNTQQLLLGGKAKYNFGKYFNIEASYSAQSTSSTSENYIPIGYQTLSVDVTKNNGFYARSYSKVNTQNGQLQLNYNQTIGDFVVGGALKSVYEFSQLDGFKASGYNLTAPVKSLDVTEQSTRSTSTSWNKTINYGYFLNGRVAWKDKIFLDALGRLDKSSRFGSDVGWAFFPRVALAYRLTEDLKLGAINEFKLRAAYGEAGSLPPFGAKDSQVTLTSTGGISYTQNDNTDLKRAITSEVELGFDAQLFKWLNVQFNYASSKSRNDFISVPSFTPLYGSAALYDNLGEVKSNSFELEIGGSIINKKNIGWDFGLTFSRVRSKITSMGDVPEFTDKNYRRAVGLSTTAIWGYSIFRSLDQLETNEAGYVTNAGDGTTTINDYTVNSLGFVVEKKNLGTADEAPVFYKNDKTGDRKVIGDAQPDFIVGFTNTFRFGPLSLYAAFDWKQGGEKYNETVQYLTYVFRSQFSDVAAQAGLPLNFATSVFNVELPTDYWVEKTSYLALRELSLTYQIPVAKLHLSKYVKNASFSLVGRNLFILTNFTGSNVDGTRTADGYATDFFNYPAYRSISGKFAITF